MRQLEIQGRILTDKDVWVCAEIGSNHNGDAGLCEKMIIAAAKCGADAVKLQKRDNSRMFTKNALARPYENEFSYGKTYGEHRAHLDWFGEREFLRFKAVAEKHGLIFFATPFEEESAKFLRALDIPLWKIASCDVTNLPLVRKVAGYGKPVIVSTGGASLSDIGALVETLEPVNQNYALLHCVSLYPNRDQDLNLRSIVTLRGCCPDRLIGFSSHHPGIMPLMLARMLGASIFEVHFTLDRSMKGTDHRFSLEPKGLAQAIEDLPRVRTMLGSDKKDPLPAEVDGFVRKMGKGIYLSRPKCAGERIEEGDICIKSPAGGFRPGEAGRVIGGILINDLSTGVAIGEGMIR